MADSRALLSSAEVYVAINQQLAGVIELRPTIRPEAKGIITELRKKNLGLYIISSDHEKPTQKLAAELGIDHYFAEVLPQNKASLIEQLQSEGHAVCFVGDGINDSIALKTANVSVSLRGASTVSTDAASIVLMTGRLYATTRFARFHLGDRRASLTHYSVTSHSIANS